MSIDPFFAFVSSTSDLAAERKNVKQALESEDLTGQFKAYLSEGDVGSSGTPEDRLVSTIRAADLFFLILGPSYGSLYPKPPERSIVEWELEVAARLTRGRAIFALLKANLGEVVDPRQKGFIERVKNFESGHWVRSFDDLDSLRKLVRQAAIGWLGEIAKNIPRIRRHLIAAIVTGASAAIGLVMLVSHITSPAFIAIGAILVITLVLIALIYLVVTP